MTEFLTGRERGVKYLEDSIKDIGLRADYSAIYFTMSEEQSEYATISFVKFSELAGNLVGSFNALASMASILAPWTIAILLIAFIWKLSKRRM